MSAIRRLPGIFSSAGSRFFAAGCPQQAAGIAYRVLFSLAPLAIVLVAVFGLVLQDDDARQRVIDTIVDALPVDASGAADVESAIEDIATPASAAGLVSLLVLLWAASGMMTAIRRGLDLAMGVEQGRPAVRGKLVDLALVAGTGLLVLLSVGAALVPEFAHGGAAQSALAVALPFLGWVGTAFVLYRFVAVAGLPSVDALAGAFVTGLLLLAISLVTDLLYAKTTEWSVIYGSLTSILVFLYSVYLYSSALLFGAGVAAEWSRPHEPSGETLRAKVGRAVRGLFVRERKSQSGDEAR